MFQDLRELFHVMKLWYITIDTRFDRFWETSTGYLRICAWDCYFHSPL